MNVWFGRFNQTGKLNVETNTKVDREGMEDR